MAAVHKKDCHDGPIEVLKIGNTRIWGGSYVEARGGPVWSLMVSCAGASDQFKPKPPFAMVSEAARALLPEELIPEKIPPFLAIDWPDMGIPHLRADWWEKFYDFVEGSDLEDIVFYCFGGHGRTGTALSILKGIQLSRKGTKKKPCPVEAVRKVYCENAVEDNSQLDYIEEVTGVRVTAEAAKSFGKSYYGGAAGTGAQNKLPAVTAPKTPTAPTAPLTTPPFTVPPVTPANGGSVDDDDAEEEFGPGPGDLVIDVAVLNTHAQKGLIQKIKDFFDQDVAADAEVDELMDVEFADDGNHVLVQGIWYDLTAFELEEMPSWTGEEDEHPDAFLPGHVNGQAL